MTEGLVRETERRKLPAAPRPPRVRSAVVVLSILAGTVIAVLWSVQLVDDEIGQNVAAGLLGHDAATANITGSFAALAFAFVTGVAGTFTACNIAVFSAAVPFVEDDSRLSGRIRRSLRPLGWISLSAGVVAAVYGGAGVLMGDRLPQLSTATAGAGHVPVRLVQSMIVFSVIGVVMLVLGLGAAGVLPDPLAKLRAYWQPAPQIVLGVLIGAFLIGRPWPMFHRLFQHAADTHNVLLGAGAFVLVVLGNMLLMAVLLLILSATGFPRWINARPQRLATVTAVALLVGGAFTLIYWGLRVPAHFGIGWFPTMPWR